MTIGLTANRNDYVGNGSASVFSFTFPAFVSADITVYVADANGTQTQLTLAQDYTISGLPPASAPPGTGSITLVNNSQAWLSGGNLATGYTLSIVRAVARSQGTSLRNQGSYFPEVIENEIDDAVMMIQDLGAPALVLPPSVNPATFSPVLPANIAKNPGSVLLVDPTGTKIILGTPVASVIPNPLPVSQGGTGATAVLSGNRIIASSASPQKLVEVAALTPSKPLRSDANGLPTTGNTSLTSEVAGVLPVASGGTNSLTPLNSNRAIVSSGGAIVEAAAMTASRVICADANGLPTTAPASTVSLSKPLSFVTTTDGIVGTPTNDNASAGKVGEYIESVISVTAVGATNVYTDLTSISLTAGDWDITGIVEFDIGTPATWSDTRMGISTTSGNSATGLNFGSSASQMAWANSSTVPTVIQHSVPAFRVSVASTTTFFLKARVTYSAGTPQIDGARLSARRVR